MRTDHTRGWRNALRGLRDHGWIGRIFVAFLALAGVGMVYHAGEIVRGGGADVARGSRVVQAISLLVLAPLHLVVARGLALESLSVASACRTSPSTRC